MSPKKSLLTIGLSWAFLFFFREGLANDTGEHGVDGLA